MRSTYYNLSAALIGLLTVAAIPEIDSEVKVTVVKHKGLETSVLDTTFDESTGYTVEQFLIDNGLNPEETEIIDTDAFDGKYTWKRDDSFLFLNGTNVNVDLTDSKTVIVETIVESDKEELEEIIEDFVEKEVLEEVYVIKKDDGNGETTITTTTIVNGEKTTTEETVPSGEVIIMGDGEWESNENIQEILKKLEVEMEGLEFDFEELENTMKDVKVEFVEIEEVMKDAEIDFEELEKHMKTEMKVIVNGESIDIDSEDGNGSFKYIIKESSDSPQNVTVISTGKSFSEDEIVFEEVEALRDSEYTVAIVTRTNKQAEDSGMNDEEVFIADPAKLPIEGPFYYPNPTQGKFRLEFFLPERGQTQIQVFDMQGRMVYEDNLGNFQGAFNEEVNLSNLEPGTYVMNITQNNLRLAEKIIVN
ncbi:MAG: T9SS type A sorting domain-containing protein [Bacteroidota bacterium]